MSTAFKNIKPGEIFYDGACRYRKLAPAAFDSDLLDNAQRADNNRSTKRFEDTDRFDVSVPTVLRCAWWRRVLIRYSLGWQVHGHHVKARLAWRLSRLWATEATEMAMAAHAARLLMLGDG